MTPTETDPDVLAAQNALLARRRELVQSLAGAPPTANTPDITAENLFPQIGARVAATGALLAPREAEIRAVLAERSRTEARKALRENMERRGVPHDMWRVLMASALPKTPALGVLARATAWREGRSMSGSREGMLVILSGHAGSGKSVAGGAVVSLWPRTALYVTAATVGALPDTDWSENHTTRQRWEQVDFLFLDEIGVEWSARGARRVLTLLMQRYNSGRFTACSTNQTEDEFIATYLNQDPHMRSRLESRLDMRQARNGAQDGFPWWWGLNPRWGDFRDPSRDPFDAMRRGEMECFQGLGDAR